MCGLVGLAGKNPQNSRRWLSQARTQLVHRGPDSFGEWWSDGFHVGLAHQRLSVIDRMPAGNQPMHLMERGLSIIFNGEIYNHNMLRSDLIKAGYTFQSSSDTEVLLASYAHWGRDCLSRLNGMFSFAIYDAKEEELFMARDRSGEKPLFYRIQKDTLYFASELKSLLCHPQFPRLICPESLDYFLAMGFVPGHRCILKDYKKLEPAHALSFDLRTGSATIWRYWQAPELDSGRVFSERDLLDELEALLEQAVGMQLVADVPVGVLLSGGLDSSLITAMALRHSHNVRTFSVGFPGNPKGDEPPHARGIARHFGTEHTELMVESPTVDLLPILAQQFDEPLADSSMVPMYLVSKSVRQHCTVALGGDGGDELFGGYNHYRRLLWMQRNLSYIPHLILRAIAQTAERFLPVGVKGRNYLQGLGVDLDTGVPLLASYFDLNGRQLLLRGNTSNHFVADVIHATRTPNQQDLLQRATRMDFENYLAEDILVKVDRASMLTSLEIRAPFLDYRLIEFAFARVPSRLKATDKDTKILLKRLGARVLPAEFDKKRKQGFSIPLAAWLKNGPFRQLFWDTLTSADCMFDSKTVRSLLEGQDKGRSNSERLFALVQFELWRKLYKAAL